MLKHLVTTLILVASLATASARPVDWDDPEVFPLEGLAIYDGYRGALIKKGWRPVPHRNAYADGFPEVVCGNALCSADWRSPGGRPVSFTLWPYYHGDSERLILFLAPALDDGNLPP
jgi:hypothetical protein